MSLFIILGMIGIWQIVIIVLIIVLLFGAKKIPELMKGIGKGMNEFNKAKKEGKSEGSDDIKE